MDPDDDLPPGWTQRWSQTQGKYYHHNVNDRYTTWDKPEHYYQLSGPADVISNRDHLSGMQEKLNPTIQMQSQQLSHPQIVSDSKSVAAASVIDSGSQRD